MKNNSTSETRRFFILTFLFSWLMWLPGVLITFNILKPEGLLYQLSTPLNYAGGVGPSLAAFFLAYVSGGKKAVIELLKRVVNPRGGIIYTAIFLYMPLMLIAGHFINIAFLNGTFPQPGLLLEPWFIPLVFSVFFVMQFSEEFGWRGCALKGLQGKYGPVLSSLIVGVMWALWHIPMFLSNGFPHHHYGLPYHQLFVTLVSVSFVITYFQNTCKGSLLPAFIIHSFINMSNEILPLFNKESGDYTVWVIVNVLILCTALLLILSGRMSEGRNEISAK